MNALIFLAFALLIASIPVTIYLALKLVLTHLEAIQVVGGLPKELRSKELEIAAIQVEIAKVKEQTRQAIAETQQRRANIHE